MEEAEKMLREENVRLEKQRKEYIRKVRRLHGAIIDTLPEVEQKIVAYLSERLYENVEVEEIQKKAGFDAATVEKALAHLLQFKVVSQWKSDNYI